MQPPLPPAIHPKASVWLLSATQGNGIGSVVQCSVAPDDTLLTHLQHLLKYPTDTPQLLMGRGGLAMGKNDAQEWFS